MTQSRALLRAVPRVVRGAGELRGDPSLMAALVCVKQIVRTNHMGAADPLVDSLAGTAIRALEEALSGAAVRGEAS